MPRQRPRKPRRGQRDLTLPYQEYRFDVGEPDHGGRLDSFLAARLDWQSRRRVQQLIAAGMVEILPGKDPQQAVIGAMRDGLKLRKGQEVILRTPNPQPVDSQPKVVAPDVQDDLEVVWEDDQILAVNKPPHINVHPSHGHLTGSLIHLIHERHRQLYPEHSEVPTLCHRVDRETSGVVLTAKDQLSRTRIGRQFEARQVKKSYLALVRGIVEQDQGIIDLPLGRSLTSEVRLKMAVRHDSEGMPSITEWRVAQRLRDLTLIELYPQTGRQHQLRVHLAAIGHPILGDKLYLGGEEVFLRGIKGKLTAEDHEILGLNHQALHSWKLTLEHPFTGRQIILEASLPRDVKEIVDSGF